MLCWLQHWSLESSDTHQKTVPHPTTTLRTPGASALTVPSHHFLTHRFSRRMAPPGTTHFPTPFPHGWIRTTATTAPPTFHPSATAAQSRHLANQPQHGRPNSHPHSFSKSAAAVPPTTDDFVTPHSRERRRASNQAFGIPKPFVNSHEHSGLEMTCLTFAMGLPNTFRGWLRDQGDQEIHAAWSEPGQARGNGSVESTL